LKVIKVIIIITIEGCEWPWKKSESMPRKQRFKNCKYWVLLPKRE